MRLRLIEDFQDAVGIVDKDGAIGGVNEPAQGGSMLEAMNNIFDDLGLALVRGEDFVHAVLLKANRPVGGDRKDVGNLA